MYEDTIFPIQALETGARGYITKASAPEILVEAIHAVALGTRYLSADIEKALACQPELADEKLISSLTTREFEILRLIAHGHTVEAIAEKLFLTPKTVANHQSSIKRKLGADNSAQLVRIAMKLGVTS
jgi:DNA-binding NarL/FixJ family response regulator